MRRIRPAPFTRTKGQLIIVTCDILSCLLGSKVTSVEVFLRLQLF